MTFAMRTCRICSFSSENAIFIGREMMFGTREEFEYFQCIKCGCLQISEIPKELGKHYPSNYYSYQSRPQPNASTNCIIGWARTRRCETALFGRKTFFDRIIELLVDPPTALSARPNGVSSIHDLLRRSRIQTFDAKILDVGCGSRSEWLETLERLGFRNLFGLDPFISENQRYGHITIAKRDFSDDDEEYDLITFHHSLEHIADQLETAKQIAAHLKLGGFCIIRIPTVSSSTWERYGTNWIEMDPPRHLYLHSIDSMKFLADFANLEIIASNCDSTDFEFYGSEMYARDVHLMHENSPWVDSRSTLFSREERDEFRRSARAAVNQGTGGRAVFYLRKRVV